jgi:hypothetical protein
MPPDAAYPDTRGAIATAVFYLEQYPIVIEAQDLRVWDALSGPDCAFCQAVHAEVIGRAQSGQYETGGHLTIDENNIVANYYVDGFTYVTLSYSQEPSTLHNADGTTEPSGDGGSGTANFQMSLDANTWKVNDVGIEEE